MSSAICVDGLNTLIDYRYQQHFKAKTGVHGMGKNRHGAKGADAVLKVPAGTQIFEEDEETLIADLTEVGQTAMIARGGNGGFGNLHFTTSTNRAPRRANPGQEGIERTHHPAAEADRRRRADRPAQRRQIDLSGQRQRRQAEDRRLSLHDAASGPRRGAGGRSRIRARRHSRPHRGRA